jgi:NitT/TauT family transport system substrate-binding protein
MRAVRLPAAGRLGRGWRAVAAVAATLSLALAACGGQSAHSEDPNNLGMLKVIETGQYDVPMIGADAATDLGMWNKSLHVQIAVGEHIGEALASGDVDVGIGSPNRVIGAIMQGLQAKIVGATIPWWDQYVVASTKSGAAKPADLKGKTFGVTSFGSAGHYSTVKLAQSLGWSKNDYKIVTMGNINGLNAGLKNGTIDAFLWSAFPAYTLEQSNDAKVLGSIRDLVGPNPLDVIVVSDKALENRPKAVEAFCDGYYGAVKKLQTDPKEALDLFVNKWGKDPVVTPKVINQELGLLSKDGAISDEMLKNMIDATKFTVEGVDSLDMNTMRGLYHHCGDR